jgi:hypothetical protein
MNGTFSSRWIDGPMKRFEMSAQGGCQCGMLVSLCRSYGAFRAEAAASINRSPLTGLGRTRSCIALGIPSDVQRSRHCQSTDQLLQAGRTGSSSVRSGMFVVANPQLRRSGTKNGFRDFSALANLTVIRPNRSCRSYGALSDAAAASINRSPLMGLGKACLTWAHASACNSSERARHSAGRWNTSR